MIVSVFDMTDDTQLSVKESSEGLLLTVLMEKVRKDSAKDECDWETAVRLAEWILAIDNEVGPHY